MTKNKDKKQVEQPVENQVEKETVETVNNTEAVNDGEAAGAEEVSGTDPLQAKVAELEARVAELEDLKLRQMAEFDNFRRRTNKEKLELMTTAGERIFCDMLPLVDDFERAKVAMAKSEDINAVREGIDLIYNKFINFSFIIIRYFFNPKSSFLFFSRYFIYIFIAYFLCFHFTTNYNIWTCV